MLFNSFPFLFVFLPLVLVFFWLSRPYNVKLSCLIMLVASVFFYSWWDIRFLPVLTVSIFMNFGFGWGILHYPHQKKKLLVGGIGLNLLGLSVFKYTNFVLDNLSVFSGIDFGHVNVELPIGISFFTFTQIAFLVDAYRNEAKEPDPVNYGLFVTYFPHLIAGPILHHKEMMPQFSDRTRRSVIQGIMVGLAVLLIGLFKKVAIADPVSVYSTPVFLAFDRGGGLSGMEAWIGALAYTFQLYFDFSAYSDMAVGISYMFGIRLPINFYSPYQAVNIIDFWRRWHMTLSRFLRDYLYIPLGGNRKGKGRRYINLMLTMLLGGLWHGAGWNFIIWGALHGGYLVINHIVRSMGGLGEGRGRVFLSWFITFIAVIIAWVFFRAETVQGAVNMVQTMFNPFSGWLPETYNKNELLETCGVLAAVLVIATLMPNVYQMSAQFSPALLPADIQKEINERPSRIQLQMNMKQGFLYGATAVLIIILMSRINIASEFLYFQF